MCLVSIIVPNYNHSAYIEKRLNSIYNQTFKDYELIVFDDASSDNSSLLIENSIREKTNVRFIKNAKNSGSTFKQWLKGLELCNGKYIWIAESDDYCEETFLEKTVEVLEKDNNINCVFVQSKWVDGKDVEFMRIPHEIMTKEQLFGEQFVKDKMLDGSYLYNASAVLFKRDAYTNQRTALLKILNNYRYCGDWLFWTYILKGGSLALLPEYLNFFRRVNNAVSEVGKLNSGAINEAFNIIKDIILNYNIKLTKLDCIKISDRLISLWKKTNPLTRLSIPQLIFRSTSISLVVSTIMIYKLIRKI